MKKFALLPLAVLAFTACDDSSKGLLAPESAAGGPSFHHSSIISGLTVTPDNGSVGASWGMSYINGKETNQYYAELRSCGASLCTGGNIGTLVHGVETGSVRAYSRSGLAAGNYILRVNGHNGGGPEWTASSAFTITVTNTETPPPPPPPAAQSVSISAPTSATYGDHNLTVSASATSELPATLSVVSGPCELVSDATTSNLKITGAGTCALLAEQAGNSSWQYASNTASIAIAQKALTVTAENKSKTYDGSEFSGFTSAIDFNGLVNGDAQGVVSGSVTYTGAATTAVNAGSHTITPVVTGLSATNYSFTPVNGTLTIRKANAVISVQGYTGIFDGSAYGATGTATGVNGVDLSGLLALAARSAALARTR